jgi:hypothetical protein
MSSNFAYYIFVLVGIIVAVIILKKVASCLVKSIAMAVIVGLLLFLYFSYFK